MAVRSPTPIPTPVPPEGLVLVGGTFDPPHAAHVGVGIAARREVFGERAALVFVPAARSPHRPVPPIASDAQRVEMLLVALADVERCGVWTDELDRAEPGAPSFWVQTLERARTLAPGVPLAFVMGLDQAASFHRWREPQRILELATPVIAPRGDDSPASIDAALAAWEPEARCIFRVIRAGLWAISSSAVRGRVRELGGVGLTDDPQLAGSVPPGVLERIEQWGLYRGSIGGGAGA